VIIETAAAPAPQLPSPRQLMCRMDAGGSLVGALAGLTVVRALHAGVEATPEAVEACMTALDADGSGSVDMEEMDSPRARLIEAQCSQLTSFSQWRWPPRRLNNNRVWQARAWRWRCSSRSSLPLATAGAWFACPYQHRVPISAALVGRFLLVLVCDTRRLRRKPCTHKSNQPPPTGWSTR
jgi:hypothetical protein